MRSDATEAPQQWTNRFGDDIGAVCGCTGDSCGTFYDSPLANETNIGEFKQHTRSCDNAF